MPSQSASISMMPRCGEPQVFLAITLLLAIAGSAWAAEPERSRIVHASAYNSLPGQTDDEPSIAAWGDRLEPGMAAIAVSRDLLELGLTRGVRVRIEGLPGEYVVLDKMAARWRNKIDIYMAEDVEAARRWGVREVRIQWSAIHP